MAILSLRIKLGGGHVGHGKIELLEHIAREGSISGGARCMRMSYKRAWDLVEELNRIFGKPVIATQSGGKNGGGARLTETGAAIVSAFRAIEQSALAAAHSQIEMLEAQIANTDSEPPGD